MGVKKGQELTVEVTDLAFGGRGLVRVDGMAVFVDQAVPGDRVLARVVRKKRRYAEARTIEVLEPSADRVKAPCPYSGTCGGCKWQFLSYDRQLAYKRQQVSGALRHIGLMDGVPVHTTLPSERIFGYRNKMEFSCSDRRWLLREELENKEISRDFALGLHVPGTFHKVLDTRACLLQPEAGNRILDNVREKMKTSGLPPYGLRSHEGFWRFLVLRHSVAKDRWLVNLVTAGEETGVLTTMAGELMEEHSEIVAVVNNVTARKAAVAFGEYEVPLAGANCLVDRIGRHHFGISANSFFQTNTRGAERLYGVVRDYAALKGTETVFDLYSGIGTIAIHLAEACRRVVGLEIVESAVSDAVDNCRRNGIDNCRFVQGDIAESLSGIRERPDLLVIDPPRAGMHKKVLRLILELNVDRIVYVSCNPGTLARDLGVLAEQYAVREVQPVDMFPHTYHIEAVARLERRRG
ncbi:MAG: 23S rRNA (uracil(1939)-C(5))-methyltransferase RlmD [Desulfobacteraceae bacterium]|nr:23S rRNA (uracil(1939)-C(5))-methyltransferase RlmD [Desulfobacteraceae bacterium]